MIDEFSAVLIQDTKEKYYKKMVDLKDIVILGRALWFCKDISNG